MVFWLIAGVMILVAFAIILPPIWRAHSLKNTENLDQRNVDIARERLAELKANRDNGGISQAQYEEQETELELALSDDLSISKLLAQSPMQGRWLVYVLAVVIPCVSIALYFGLGDVGAITRSREVSSEQAADMPSPEQINKMVSGLSEKLKKDPNNLQGWVMLGRSYKVMQKYPEAVDAISHAFALAKDNTEIALQYAEVLMLANNNNWAGKPVELINKVLAVEPNNLTGLWFSAMSFAQQGNKAKAVEILRKMAVQLPADSPDKKQIDQLIANAEAEGGISASTQQQAQEPAPAPASSGLTVTVQVSLAQSLNDQVAPGDTIFIYAQAVSGPKMPIAIARKHVSDLPIKVSLSDANAMLPNMKLSNFKQLRLLARVSKSASAMPMPGDLIGKIEEADIVNVRDYKILIADKYK